MDKNFKNQLPENIFTRANTPNCARTNPPGVWVLLPGDSISLEPNAIDHES